jgi:hypothetical protein
MIALIRVCINIRIRCRWNACLRLILRPTVSLPVCLGIKHPSGAYDQIFITAWQLRICSCGALSLTRGRVCRLQLLLVLTSALIFGSVSRWTCDHILLTQIRDILFVASYGSQAHGGGIRPGLHTGWKHVYQTVVQQRSIPRCHGNVLSEALRNRLSYFVFQGSSHNILWLKQ